MNTMKQKCTVSFLLSILCLLPVSGCQIATKQERESNAFRSFLTCDRTPEEDAVLSQLRNSAKPIAIEDGIWVYAYKSKILGNDSDRIMLGVCDDGSVDCGWGWFLAFQINKTFDSAKADLLESHGIDFTVQLRSEDVEDTLRPYLAKHKVSNETLLICDPGTM